MWQQMFTAAINLFTFLALTVTTMDIKALMSTMFLFAASILLESMSVYNEPDREKSFLIKISFVTLLIVGLGGVFLSLSEYLGLFSFTLEGTNESMHLYAQSPTHGLLFAPKTDMTDIVNYAGLIVTSVPVFLACRLTVIHAVRKNYSLADGFYSK